MRKILRYANSHRYEIHAILVATVVVVLMLLIKKPIKKWIANQVDNRIARKPGLFEKRYLLNRRGNMLLIVLTMLLSFGLFWVASVVSPLIEFSISTAIMTGVFALCEYAFLDQITFDIRDEDE